MSHADILAFSPFHAMYTNLYSRLTAEVEQYYCYIKDLRSRDIVETEAFSTHCLSLTQLLGLFNTLTEEQGR